MKTWTAALLLACAAGCAFAAPTHGDEESSDLASSLQAHDQCFAVWQSHLEEWVARNEGFRSSLAETKLVIADDARTSLSAMIRDGWANQSEVLVRRPDRETRLEIARAFDRAIPDTVPEGCRSSVWIPTLILNSPEFFMAGARDDLLAQAPPEAREDDTRFVNWFLIELLSRS